jgi:hypothetical protein
VSDVGEVPLATRSQKKDDKRQQRLPRQPHSVLDEFILCPFANSVDFLKTGASLGASPAKIDEQVCQSAQRRLNVGI